MDTPLFPPDSAPTPETPPAETPPETPPIPPAPDPAVAELREQVQTLASTLQQAMEAPAPEPTPPAPEPQDPSDYLTDLANKPQETIQREALRIAQAVVAQGYGGTAQQLTDTSHKMLISEQRQAIDGEFGKGTWKELYEPALASDLEAIRKANPVALSNPDSIQILVDRVTGQQRAALNERESKHKTAQQEEWVSTRTEIANSLPPSGLTRRSSADGEPDDETKLFLAEVGNATGEKMDPKQFVKLMTSGNKLEDWQSTQKKGAA